jgi:hypothetical protein
MTTFAVICVFVGLMGLSTVAIIRLIERRMLERQGLDNQYNNDMARIYQHIVGVSRRIDSIEEKLTAAPTYQPQDVKVEHHCPYCHGLTTCAYCEHCGAQQEG